MDEELQDSLIGIRDIVTIRRRVQNDTDIGDPWPESKYRMYFAVDCLRLDQYFCEDADRRNDLRLGQDASSSGGTAAADGVFSDDQSDECRRSDDMLPIWFKEDIESNCRPASEDHKGTSYPAGPGREIASEFACLSTFLLSIV